MQANKLSMLSHSPEKMPPLITTMAVTICVLPFIFSFLGFDFSSNNLRLNQSSINGVNQDENVGNFIHSILEWTAFCAASITVVIAYSHYRILHNAVILLVSVTLFFSGCMDALHVLASNHLIGSNIDNQNFIPFSWALSRFLNALFLISGISFLLYIKKQYLIVASYVVIAISAVFALLAYLVILYLANIGALPQAIFPNQIINRPYDIFSLALFLFAWLYLFPKFHRNYPSMFSHALIISMIFESTSQLYMVFGSTNIFDHAFNIAHFIKIFAYLTPFLGLLLDYSNTYINKEIEIERRKETEIALAAAKNRAETANKAKSSFLANMSHEFRTPLNGVLGYTQLMERDPKLTRAQKERVAVIRHSGEHLLSLIDDVLDLSKIEAGRIELQLQDFELNKFLQEIVDTFELRAMQTTINFSYKKLPPLPKYVTGDDNRLRQIIINLLSNAMKFTHHGGTVTFKVAYQQDKIHLQVEDTGIGISQENKGRIFSPFEQASDELLKSEGTGLGLSISQKLAGLMGGYIQVESELGKGSRFWLIVSLPVSEPSHANEQYPKNTNIVGYEMPADPTSGRPENSRHKILVVDDNKFDRMLLTNLLIPLGFEVLEAEDGKQAVNKAIEWKPDLIFMDMIMPTMDGFEATKEIRTNIQSDELKIIAISASVFNVHRERTKQAGCNDFIAKPFLTHDVLSCLQTHLPITWTYDENRVVENISEIRKYEMDFNPELDQEEVRVLFGLAEAGDIQSILDYLTKLKLSKPESLDSIEYLYQLAQNFDDEIICQKLKPFLEN